MPPPEAPTNGDLAAPFVRKDRFGEYGMAPQPTMVKVVLAIEALVLLPLRAVSVLLLVVLYWLICNASVALPPKYCAAVTVTAGRLVCRWALFCFGFHYIKWVNLAGAEEGPRPGGIVSNHCSYLDILLHMSDSFPAFVARKSTAKLPFIGIIRCVKGRGCCGSGGQGCEGELGCASERTSLVLPTENRRARNQRRLGHGITHLTTARPPHLVLAAKS